MGTPIHLSKQALTDLRQIVRFVARDDSQAAEKLGNQLLDAAYSLGNFPERGRVVPELRTTLYREIVVRTYRIIYRICPWDQNIEVVRFWHGSRGAPVIPKRSRTD